MAVDDHVIEEVIESQIEDRENQNQNEEGNGVDLGSIGLNTKDSFFGAGGGGEVIEPDLDQNRTTYLYP